MMFAKIVSVLVASIIASCGAGGTANAAPSRTTSYASVDPAEQSFDYFPSTGTNRPWVITIHGGSWVYGDKADPTMVAARDAFHGLGLTVFSLNYRLGGVEFKDIKSDIDTAFNYIRSHASRYGINPNRGLIYGHSAGGHLASILGLEGNGNRGVRGIITTSGVLAPHYTDNAALRAHENELNGCTFGPCWWSFLPQHYLSPNDPPILSFQGSLDTVVNPVEPVVLRWWARRAGVSMTVTFTPNYGHSYNQLWKVPSNLNQMLSFAKSKLNCPSKGC